MLVAARGEKGAGANDGRVRSGSSGAEQGQARKKARCDESMGPGAIGTKTDPLLRVNVNASRLPSPRQDQSFRRSLSGDDESIDETSDATNLESEEPFVMARKLLRRRHVRKEQLRKDREAREVLNARESRNNRRRMGGKERNDLHPSGARGLFGSPPLAGNSTIASLPQLSPMLLKTGSFSDMTLASPNDSQNSNVNHAWRIEVGDSPNVKIASLNGSVTPDLSSSARIVFSRTTHSSMARISFSPLRSRNIDM